MAADFVFSATSALPLALVAQVHLILAGRILRIDRRDLRIAALQGAPSYATRAAAAAERRSLVDRSRLFLPAVGKSYLLVLPNFRSKLKGEAETPDDAVCAHERKPLRSRGEAFFLTR